MKKIFLIFLIFFLGSSVFASDYVPLNSWVYPAIQKLAAYGLIPLQKLGTKPYRRKDVAKWTKEAIKKINENKIKIDDSVNDIQAILLRMKSEFLDTKEPTYQLSEESTYAHLNVSPFNTGNQNGHSYFNGLNQQFSLRAHYKLNKNLDVVINPVAYYQNSTLTYPIQEGYLTYDFRHWQWTIGRLAQWWGPAINGDLFLTNNAFPFTLARVTNNSPFYFPWVLKKIFGPSYYTFYITRLEGDRPIPYPFITGHHFEINPIKNLSIGFSRTILLGGQGRNSSLDPGTYLKIFTGGPGVDEEYGVYQEAGWDWTWRIPTLYKYVPFLGQTMEVYGEMGNEAATKNVLEMLNSPQGVLFGVFIPGIFWRDGLDLRAEYVNLYWTGIDNLWYTHSSIYNPGLVYDGYVIGDPIGTGGKGAYVDITHRLSDEWIVDYSLSDLRHHEGHPFPETEYTAGINVQYLPLEYKKTSVNFGAMYIGLNNVNEVSGVKANNFLLYSGLNFKF